jgi:hypothetical protein
VPGRLARSAAKYTYISQSCSHFVLSPRLYFDSTSGYVKQIVEHATQYRISVPTFNDSIILRSARCVNAGRPVECPRTTEPGISYQVKIMDRRRGEGWSALYLFKFLDLTQTVCEVRIPKELCARKLSSPLRQRENEVLWYVQISLLRANN